MTGETFKNKLQKLIDDDHDHFHENIQLHDNFPMLTTDAHVAKRKRKYTSKIENGKPIAHKIEELATCQIQGTSRSVWNEWLNSKILKVIAVVGQSRAGKSNLAKKILKSQRIKDFFQYRFYISLKGSCENEMNLLEFLTQRKLHLRWVEEPNNDNHSVKFYDTMIDKLNSEKVCIVFDDFGIGSFSYNKDEEELSCFKKHPAKKFFSSILKHDLLRNAKVVIVLNHWDYEHITMKMHPQTWTLVHVLGIDEKDQTRMAEGILCDLQTCCAYNTTKNKTAILKINSSFKFHVGTKNCLLCKNPSLSNCFDEFRLFLNVPIHCQSFLKQCSGCGIANTSYLLLKWLQHIAIIYPAESYCLINVGKFAWTKYAQHRFLFAFKDLENLSKVERNIFFISLRHIQGSEKDLYYRCSNILLQDFLAAVWCLSLSDVELENNQAQFEEWNNSEIVIGFMNEIYRFHNQSLFGQQLNQENIFKIQQFSSRSNNNENFRTRRGLLDTAQDFIRNFFLS